MHQPRTALLRVLPLLVLAVLAAGCGPGATASSTPPSASPPAAVTTPEQAAAIVLAENPDFAGILPKDPDMIGGCCFYEVTQGEGGHLVTVEMGWGDCMAGCINRHRWTYAVTPTGEVGLVNEEGVPIPPGGIPPSM